MADITKCANKTCQLRDKCYRFTANSNSFRQACANFDYNTINKVTTCDHFWDNEEYEKYKKVEI